MTQRQIKTPCSRDSKKNKDEYEQLSRMLQRHASELQTIDIQGRQISNDDKVFVVAEAACNHMCDMNLAKKLIDKAVDAGADAIKFQTYKAEKLVTKNAVAFWGEDKISQQEYYRRLDRFDRTEYKELFKYAHKKGIIAFSSPFDAESTEMLAEIGMPVFKIASCDIPDIRHLRYVASFGRPIILSTGASTINEIARAVREIFNQDNYQLMLLACTLSYPTKNEDANLRRIQTLKKCFPNIIIGLSDHTEPDNNMVIPSVAVALGARIIEKHYTLDRSMTGSGHFFAVDPDDLKRMVENIRLTEQILGQGRLGVTESEEKAWGSARRSIVADVPIAEGTFITSKMIGLKRPANGLPASLIDQVIGKTALKDIQEDEFISLDMLEE